MNESKKREWRHWERWIQAGAVSTVLPREMDPSLLRPFLAHPKPIGKNSYRTAVYGLEISLAIERTTALAKALEATISFEFNAVIVSVRGDSDRNLIYRDYSRAFIGSIGKNIGPYPTPALTDEQNEHDMRAYWEREARLSRLYAEQRKAALLEEERVDAIMTTTI